MPRPIPLEAPVITIARPASGGESTIDGIIVRFDLMRLLVSVRNASEAAAALDGGADIVDAKEPGNGALGPVSHRTLTAIMAAVAGATPVSVALGETSRDDVVSGARAATRAGVAFGKVGFAGMRRQRRTAAHAVTAVAALLPAATVLVAYADHERADAPSPEELLDIAHRSGAAGILLDTYDKGTAGLSALMTSDELRAFVSRAKSFGHVVALAGKLTLEDIGLMHAAGADVVGFRGAACAGGRSGVVTADRVRALRHQIDRAVGAALRPVV